MKPSNVIFLLGCSQTGKDTVGQHLVNNYNYKRVSFADAVKEQYAKENGLDVRILHEQGPSKEKHRGGMIELAESARLDNPLCWLEKAFEPYMQDNGLFKEDQRLVVTDCRRLQEIDWVYKWKAIKQLSENQAKQAGETAKHYFSVDLWYIRRPVAEVKDADVLTHSCIGYAKGLHKGISMELNHFPLIDITIYNDKDIHTLYRKVDKALEIRENPIFI